MAPRFLFATLHDESLYGARALGAHLKRAGFDDVHYMTVRLPFEAPGIEAEADLRDEASGAALKITRGDLDLFREALDEIRPDAVGFTASSFFHTETRLLTEIARTEKNLPVLWGGPDAIVNPDVAVEAADIVCTGEGEGPILEIARRMEGLARPRDLLALDLDDVPGIWRRMPRGEVARNAPAPPQAIESLAPVDRSDADYWLICEGRLRRGFWHPRGYVCETRAIVMTSLGCPMRCAFCCHSAETESGITQWPVRRKSVDQTMAELKALLRAQPRLEHLFFVDEIFTLQVGWLEEFAERYRSEIGLPFCCYTHPKTTTPERAQLLRRAGVQDVIMGVQSGSTRVNREIFERPVTGEDCLRAGEVLHEAGIDYAIELIVGDPREREEDHRATLDLVRRLPRPYRSGFPYRLIYLRNTALTKGAEAEGLALQWLNPVMAVAEEGPEADFWRAMLNLCCLHDFSEAAVRRLLEDPGVRADPWFLYEFCKVLDARTYHAGYDASRVKKDDLIARLEAERRELEGSRFVRAAMRMRSAFARKSAGGC